MTEEKREYIFNIKFTLVSFTYLANSFIRILKIVNNIPNK